MSSFLGLKKTLKLALVMKKFPCLKLSPFGNPIFPELQLTLVLEVLLPCKPHGPLEQVTYHEVQYKKSTFRGNLTLNQNNEYNLPKLTHLAGQGSRLQSCILCGLSPGHFLGSTIFRQI